MCADYIRCPFPGIRKVFRSAGILPAVAEASRLRTCERDARADSRRDGGATAVRYPYIGERRWPDVASSVSTGTYLRPHFLHNRRDVTCYVWSVRARYR